MDTNLKVGDKVRVGVGSRFAGIEGVVERLAGTTSTVRVTDSGSLDNPNNGVIYPYSRYLELLEEPIHSPNNGEAVAHPAHYGGDTTYEAIKVIEAWDLGFHLGNTVKYISRAGKKDKTKLLEDLKKALWYLQRKIAKLEAEGND